MVEAAADVVGQTPTRTATKHLSRDSAHSGVCITETSTIFPVVCYLYCVLMIL